ncbi:MAG: hypothetical protein OEW00_09550, partial [candidate division Zixibacteria bacterium]|nr:hypothetical protein [candidate division Zixibacteria bacterium]
MRKRSFLCLPALAVVILVAAILPVGCSDENPVAPPAKPLGTLKWVWQNPLPTGNGLTAVSFVSADVGT